MYEPFTPIFADDTLTYIVYKPNYTDISCKYYYYGTSDPYLETCTDLFICCAVHPSHLN